MVVPQDDNHSSGSSTCLPNDPYQQTQVEESQEHKADFSTVPPTPNVRSFLASPVRMSTGRYNFRSTPERLHSGRLSMGSGSGSSSGGVGSDGRCSGNAAVTATSLVALSTTTTATTNSSANHPNAATTNSSHGRYSSNANPSIRPNATGATSSNANPSIRPNATNATSSNANPSTHPNATGATSSNANPSATRPNGSLGLAQPTSARARGGRNNPPVATVAVTRAGVRNYSSDELDRMLQCIRTVLPTGNNMWELVAQLHGNYFPDCNRNAVSIKKFFYQLANKLPTTGNSNIPPSVGLAKEIWEDINAKAGVTDAHVSDLFDGGVAVDDDVLGEVADDNQQGQMVLERLPSAASSSVTGATTSIIGLRAKTPQNQVASAIEATSSSANASFPALLQQRQMAEEFEWKQRRLEIEEARARHEEELH
jgi:hypothetical protein